MRARIGFPAWAFRAARPASFRTNGTKTAVQIVVVWGFALGVLPAVVRRVERRLGVPEVRFRGQRPLGVALFLTASALGLRAAWVMAQVGEGTPVPFDAARRLVVVGPYRIVRNPMVVSAIAQSAAVALATGSPSSATIPVAGVVLWQRYLRPPEEAFLRTQFGADYDRYCRAVRCWRPTWPPYES